MTVDAIRTHGPNQDLVDYVETLLEDAKSGRLQSIAGLVVFDSGRTADFWVRAPRGYPVDLHSDRMIGCLERVKFQLMAHRHGLETDDIYNRPDAS